MSGKQATHDRQISSESFRSRSSTATLDAALTKYASVEPREGSGRSNSGESSRRATHSLPARTWWRWGLAVLAAIAVVAIALAFDQKSM